MTQNQLKSIKMTQNQLKSFTSIGPWPGLLVRCCISPTQTPQKFFWRMGAKIDDLKQSPPAHIFAEVQASEGKSCFSGPLMFHKIKPGSNR